MRVKALLKAAENYSLATQRFMVYLRGAPEVNSSRWQPKFRTIYDRRFQEMQNAERMLLKLARLL
ncbi:MAG TPA: hypothetical protein VGF44_03845 [Terriglobales bacterium]